MLAFVAVQDKLPDPNPEPRKGDTINVRGCIRAGAIENAETEVRDRNGRYSGSVTYRLTGDKKLLKEIKKEHDNHVDVLTGVLKSDLPHQNAPGGKRLGIVVGMGDPSRSNNAAPPYMPVLQVEGIEHTGMNCRK
jgi:hypothetical protein